MLLSEVNSNDSKYFIIQIYATSCWAFSWSVCTPGNMRAAIWYLCHSHKVSVSNPLSTPTPALPYISQNQPLASNEKVGCKRSHLQPNDSGATVCNYSRTTCENDSRQRLPYTAVSVTQTDIPEAEDPGGAEGLCWDTLRSQVCHFAQWVVISELALWAVQLSNSSTKQVLQVFLKMYVKRLPVHISSYATKTVYVSNVAAFNYCNW